MQSVQQSAIFESNLGHKKSCFVSEVGEVRIHQKNQVPIVLVKYWARRDTLRLTILMYRNVNVENDKQDSGSSPVMITKLHEVGIR